MAKRPILIVNENPIIAQMISTHLEAEVHFQSCQASAFSLEDRYRGLLIIVEMNPRNDDEVQRFVQYCQYATNWELLILCDYRYEYPSNPLLLEHQTLNIPFTGRQLRKAVQAIP